MPIAASLPPAQSDQFHAAHGFPPIANDQARLLILGSMPGIASLRVGQYYAHPRNQFWLIMAALLERDLIALPYPERVQSLIDARIALWDVLQSCQRPGSLDADIAPDSIIANDFAPFFARHPGISHVFFNGATAEQQFKQRVQARIALPHLHTQRLPSTSPAHAALTFPAKLKAWHSVAEVLEQTG